VNFKKYEFFTRLIKFLEFIINTEDISINEYRINII